MGHGTEILIGGFCLWRALGNWAVNNTEIFLNATFGLFIFLAHGIFCWGLLYDDTARDLYDAQKGAHGFGDFSRVAEIMGTDVQGIAGFSIGVAVIIFTLSLGAGFFLNKQES